jgi:glucose uptake protein GlcU
MVSGAVFAVIVSILFAVYAVPRKFSKQNAALYAMWVGVAYFAGSIAICSVVWGFGLREQENLLSRWHLLTALRGVVWVCGTVFFNIAIDKIGLARFNQWKNFQGPIGTLLMLAFLNEVAGTKIIWLLLGMTAMFISAVLFTIKSVEPGDDDEQSNARGILFALLAAVCFGVTAFINKIVTNQGFIYSQLLYHSLSVVVSAAIIFIIQTRKPGEILHISRENWLPACSGAMFLAATILSIFSYTMIAGGVSWSITQLNAVWTILIGIFVFREVSFKKHRPRIMTGFLFALAAIVFLLFAL